MSNKLVEELKLIAMISIALPTFVMLAISPLWWSIDSIKVFAGYLLGIILTAALLGAISIFDETNKTKIRRPKQNHISIRQKGNIERNERSIYIHQTWSECL